MSNMSTEVATKKEVVEQVPEVAKKLEIKSGIMMTEEEREKGVIKKDVLAIYVKAVGGLLIAILIFSLYAATQTTQLFGDSWLTIWTSSDQVYREQFIIRPLPWGGNDVNYYFIGIYAMIVCLLAILIYSRTGTPLSNSSGYAPSRPPRFPKNARRNVSPHHSVSNVFF